MKKTISFLTLSFAFAISFSQTGAFQKKLSVPGYPFVGFTDFEFCPDGGYIFAGADLHDYNRLVVAKYDMEMNFQWAKNINTTENPGRPFITRVPAGGYALLYPAMINSVEFFLTKIHENGSILWTKKYEPGITNIKLEQFNYPKAIPLPSGEFLLSFNANKMWLAKTDYAGNMMWSNITYNDFPVEDPGFDALVMNDGSFLSCEETDKKKIFVKTSITGNIEWVRALDELDHFSEPRSMAIAADGSIMVAGLESNFFAKGFVMKMDSLCNPIWYKTYDSEDEVSFSNLEILPNGNLLIAGVNSNLPVIILLDPNGNLISRNKIGNGEPGLINKYALKTSPAGDIHVLFIRNVNGIYESNFFKGDGVTHSWCGNESFPITIETQVFAAAFGDTLTTLSTGSSSVVTAQTTALTAASASYCPLTDIQSGSDIVNFSVYPNPAQDKLTIHTNDVIKNGMNFTLSDALGRVVYERAFSGNEYTMDVSALVPGIYFFEARNASVYGSGKVIID